MLASSKYNHKPLYLSAFIIWVLGVLLMPKFCHGWDNYCWGYWSEIIAKKGLIAVYADKSPINYPPIFIYILKLYAGLIKHNDYFNYTYCLKALTWAFDVGSILLICKDIVAPKQQWMMSWLVALSPAWFYNTMIWNQVDGILAFWVLLALIKAHKGQTAFAIVACIIAINFKIQAIVSFPLIGLVCLYHKDFKGILKGLLWGAIIQAIILLPFIFIGQMHRVWLMATGSMDFFPFVSMNAQNLWHIVYSGDLTQKLDSEIICCGLSIKHFGLMLFFTSSCFVLWRLSIANFGSIKNPQVQRSDLNLEALLMIHCLISFVFFYFNTQMHERYIHPAIVSSVILAVRYKHWLQWLFFAFIYFISLESILQFLGLHIYHISLFHPTVIAILYGILGSYWLYLYLKTPLIKKAI